jgi:predicted kinase
MAVLFLICGLPGAGKTTLARQIEAEHRALRLTPDEWMARIVGDGFDAAKRDAVEAVQWDIALRVLALGVNVVLENGFWSRAERVDLRARAHAIGAETRLLYLDTPHEELLRRLEARNAELPPDTFPVTAQQLELYSTWFEPPTPEELA